MCEVLHTFLSKTLLASASIEACNVQTVPGSNNQFFTLLSGILRV